MIVCRIRGKIIGLYTYYNVGYTVISTHPTHMSNSSYRCTGIYGPADLGSHVLLCYFVCFSYQGSVCCLRFGVYFLMFVFSCRYTSSSDGCLETWKDSSPVQSVEREVKLWAYS